MNKSRLNRIKLEYDRIELLESKKKCLPFFHFEVLLWPSFPMAYIQLMVVALAAVVFV